MIDKAVLIKKYTTQVVEIEKLLVAKRLDLGTADSAKESSVPTGRVELEDAIEQLQDKLKDSKDLLKVLKELPLTYDTSVVLIGCTVHIDMANEHMEFIVVPAMGDYSLGVLSTESTLGKALLNKKVDDVFLVNGSQVKIIAIF